MEFHEFGFETTTRVLQILWGLCAPLVRQHVESWQERVSNESHDSIVISGLPVVHALRHHLHGADAASAKRVRRIDAWQIHRSAGTHRVNGRFHGQFHVTPCVFGDTVEAYIIRRQLVMTDEDVLADAMGKTGVLLAPTGGAKVIVERMTARQESYAGAALDLGSRVLVLSPAAFMAANEGKIAVPRDYFHMSSVSCRPKGFEGAPLVSTLATPDTAFWGPYLKLLLRGLAADRHLPDDVVEIIREHLQPRTVVRTLSFRHYFALYYERRLLYDDDRDEQGVPVFPPLSAWWVDYVTSRELTSAASLDRMRLALERELAERCPAPMATAYVKKLCRTLDIDWEEGELTVAQRADVALAMMSNGFPGTDRRIQTFGTDTSPSAFVAALSEAFSQVQRRRGEQGHFAWDATVSSWMLSGDDQDDDGGRDIVAAFARFLCRRGLKDIVPAQDRKLQEDLKAAAEEGARRAFRHFTVVPASVLQRVQNLQAAGYQCIASSTARWPHKHADVFE